MGDDVPMSVHQFRDDDAGYLQWLRDHPDGFVLNIQHSHHASDAKVHRADCHTISGENPAGGAWTGPSYIKVCADRLTAVEQWAAAVTEVSIPTCGTCRPTR